MRKTQILILSLSLVAGNVTMAMAAFLDSGWGTRAAGMGGAFTALADDSSAPLWNPAGIAQIDWREGSFMYAKLFTGLDEVNLGLNYLSYVQPVTGVGSFAINWANFTAAELYREDTIVLSYGRALNEVVSVGVNAKYLANSYTLDERAKTDPVFDYGAKKGKSAVTADLGMLLTPSEAFSCGISLKNITQPNIGLKTKDTVPLEAKAGVAYYISDSFVTAVDVTSRDKDFNVHVGGEGWFADDVIGVRAGANMKEITFGFSLAPKLLSTADFQVDYALIWPLQIQETTGTHRISLTTMF